MNGCIIPGTPIAIDFWNIKNTPQAAIFFLTHLHGDHIAGLTSTWKYPIYCSEITAVLLQSRLGVKEHLIKPLELSRSHVISLNEDKEESMCVTLLDAEHCPGSVMLFFEGYFGNIFHTGDFRWSDSMKHNIKNVLGCRVTDIDVLYLDNTYCDPRCDFPSRESALHEIIDIIRNHPSKAVLIGCRNLGKENMLVEIAKTFQERICVPGLMFKTLQLLNFPDVFYNETCDHSTDCRIRVTEFNMVKKAYHEATYQQMPTIGIIPTALYHNTGIALYMNYQDIHVVPYSDHCSYHELLEFVSNLRPKAIIPIVKSTSRGPYGQDISGRADMSCFTKYLCKKPRSVLTITNSLKYRNPVLPKQTSSTKVEIKRLKRKTSFAKRRTISKGVKYVDDGIEQVLLDREDKRAVCGASGLGHEHHCTEATCEQNASPNNGNAQFKMDSLKPSIPPSFRPLSSNVSHVPAGTWDTLELRGRLVKEDLTDHVTATEYHFESNSVLNGEKKQQTSQLITCNSDTGTTVFCDTNEDRVSSNKDDRLRENTESTDSDFKKELHTHSDNSMVPVAVSVDGHLKDYCRAASLCMGGLTEGSFDSQTEQHSESTSCDKDHFQAYSFETLSLGSSSQTDTDNEFIKESGKGRCVKNKTINAPGLQPPLLRVKPLTLKSKTQLPSFYTGIQKLL